MKAMLRNSKDSIKTAETVPQEKNDKGVLKELLEFN